MDHSPSHKSNLELVNDCDQAPVEAHLLWRFMLEGQDKPVGQLLDEVVRKFSFNAPNWRVDNEARTVTLLGDNRRQLDERMRTFLLEHKKKSTFQVLSQWTGEENGVYGVGGRILLSIERAAAPLFGITTYGAQLIAYVNRKDGPHVWVQRRAKHKRTFPGLLDSTVGGRLRSDESPFHCLEREAEEEASIPAEIIRDRAVAAGAINYLNITDERSQGEQGLLCPDVRLIYELEMPDWLRPVPNDGEVDDFMLLSVDQLKEAMATSQFTNALIFIDFFIRRGIITYENEPHYLEIISRLHRDNHVNFSGS